MTVARTGGRDLWQFACAGTAFDHIDRRGAPAILWQRRAKL